jgi:hypothetical protein
MVKFFHDIPPDKKVVSHSGMPPLSRPPNVGIILDLFNVCCKRNSARTRAVAQLYEEPQPGRCDYRVKSLPEAAEIILSLET